jgi:hypothetical protein
VDSGSGCENEPVPCPCVEDCEQVWINPWPVDSEPIHPRDRAKPQIIRQYPAHLSEGSSFLLRGRISNPACLPVCFVWSVEKGWLEDAETLEPTYHAPETDRAGGEPVTIALISYDGCGGRSYDQIRLTIDNLDYNGPTSP